jgi:uncharacterized protein HemX
MRLLAKSYKQQNFMLLAVALLLGLVVFKFNIQRTYREYQRSRQSEAQLLLASNAVNESADLREQLKSLQETAIRPYDRGNLLDRSPRFAVTTTYL